MSVIEPVAEIPVARAKTLRGPKHRGLGDMWWRHVVGFVASVIALFPVVYVISAAFNGDSTLSGASIFPHTFTWSNFSTLFSPQKHFASASDYPWWYMNTVVVSASTALLTVVLGALAAYAFSRFRFKGRRIGMLSLLLIQMFPQLLAVVAIYLIVHSVGSIFHVIGLNTITALIVVYLGGVMGVNTWLLKGFFDTIPAELDESARVDGATPGQVFWGVVFPLAAPVLAVIAMLSFIGTLNEFVIASALLQTTKNFTLPVGMYQLISGQYDKTWGPFAAAGLMVAIPVAALLLFLQRWIVSGLTAGSVKG